MESVHSPSRPVTLTLDMPSTDTDVEDKSAELLITGDIEVPDDQRKSENQGMGSLSFSNLSNLTKINGWEWLASRRQNVRPWMAFADTNKFRKPTSVTRLGSRMVRNIEHFQSNYLFVFIGLIVYCLITSPMLIVAVAASLGACYIISLKNAEQKLKLFGKEMSIMQQYGMVALCSLPLFWLAGAGSAIFWIIGASFVVILLHAAFFAIEATEEEVFDLQMETV